MKATRRAATVLLIVAALVAACDDDGGGGGLVDTSATVTATAEPAAIEIIATDFVRAAVDGDAAAYAAFWPPDSRQDVSYYEDLLSRTPDDLTGCDIDASEMAAREGNGGIYVDVTFPEPCGDSGLITSCELWFRRAEGQWWVAQYSCTKRST